MNLHMHEFVNLCDVSKCGYYLDPRFAKTDIGLVLFLKKLPLAFENKLIPELHSDENEYFLNNSSQIILITFNLTLVWPEVVSGCGIQYLVRNSRASSTNFYSC